VKREELGGMWALSPEGKSHPVPGTEHVLREESACTKGKHLACGCPSLVPPWLIDTGFDLGPSPDNTVLTPSPGTLQARPLAAVDQRALVLI
jgi:hypothetical protein